MALTRSILYGDTVLAHGGLQPCCITTIRKYVDEHINDEVVDGTVLDCSTEEAGNQKILLDGSVWRWNRPKV